MRGAPVEARADVDIDDAASVEVDGRRQRRAQNRVAVLDALAELFAEGVYQPGAAEIAERAGLSPRSLFRYFDDIDDLLQAAIDRQLAAARPLLDAGATAGDCTATKIERVVRSRLRLYEAIAPAARAARVCAPRRPLIAAQIHESRGYLRHQLGRLFAPELRGVRAGLLPAIDVLCSFESFDLLRREQGLPSERVGVVMATALMALLEP
jgi:AcrR family transcriptional regulator